MGKQKKLLRGNVFFFGIGLHIKALHGVSRLTEIPTRDKIVVFLNARQQRLNF